MQRSMLFALSTALIGIAACNQSSREKASEKASEVRQDADQAMQDIKENAQQAAEKVQAEAREAVKDIKENAAEARKDIAREAGKADNAIRGTAAPARDSSIPDNKFEAEGRRATRDAKAEARQTSDDMRAEARQTNRDLHEGLGMDQGKTASDKQLNERIRGAWKRDKVPAAGDVTLETVDGHVKLKGTVPSEAAKKEIASAARKVAGLTHVSDDIKVAERVGQAND